MKKLIIAIDCDDVLINGTKFIVDTYNKKYGTSVTTKCAHTSKSKEWEADRSEVIRRILEIQKTPAYRALEPRDDAIAALKRLAAHHELHLITARHSDIEDVTAEMLDRYFNGHFTAIHHVGLDASKGEVCMRVGADILIDDNAKHLADASNHGVDTLVWFGDYPWQESQGDSVKNIDHRRCDDWFGVEEVLSGHAA